MIYNTVHIELEKGDVFNSIFLQIKGNALSHEVRNIRP